MDWFTKSWRTKKKTRKQFSVSAQEKQRLLIMTNRNCENEVGRGRALDRSLTAHRGRYLPRARFQLRMSSYHF